MRVKLQITAAEQGQQRQSLKTVARNLIAERGVRDVTVREIALAAGHRNLGAVGYYFGSKERLIAEVLTDGATQIEARRTLHLERVEADGGPATVRDVVAAIVLPSVEFVAEDAENGSSFNRFLMQVSLSEPGFVDRTLAGRWNKGYQRCLRHLRRLLPDLGQAEQSRRFVFLGSYLGSLLALREGMIADPTRTHATWRAPDTLEDIITTATGMLEAPLAAPAARTPPPAPSRAVKMRKVTV